MSKDFSDDNSMSSKKISAFIDHRYNSDLVQMHSPSRRKKKSEKKPHHRANLEQLPLTNQNLRTFDSTTESLSPKTSAYLNQNTVVVDMNQLNGIPYPERDEPRPNSDGRLDGPLDSTIFNFNDTRSYNSLEFGGSNPSSEHSSDSTSLDDVCFAEYYDDNHETTKVQWPDLKVLQEFIDNENHELLANSRDRVNFRLNQKVKPSSETSSVHNSVKFVSNPNLSRLMRRTEELRFTYFRDDLNKTIHSPNLSGLLGTPTTSQELEVRKKWRDENDDHEDEKPITLEDLFQPEFYTEPLNELNQKLAKERPSSINLSQLSDTANLQVKLLTKKTEIAASKAGTITSSLSSHEYKPFWLDILNPTEEEMKVLSKTFGIHPLTTEDIFLGEAREKVELFKGYYFICFTSFDIVYERRKQIRKEQERKMSKLQELQEANEDKNFFTTIYRKITGQYKSYSQVSHRSKTSSVRSVGKKIREGELSPLSMYMIVFKDGVLTFHFSPTPHPINVRRRARILKDYLTVSSDWISYALIDDITDLFGPMIDSIEHEVNSIEEAILRMHAGENDDLDSEYDSDDSDYRDIWKPRDRSRDNTQNIFYKRSRSKSTVGQNGFGILDDGHIRLRKTVVTSSSSSSSSRSSSKILGWKRKGDMLRRIGECRKRVMSVLRLLGSKADVIKGFSKRLNETELHNSKRDQAQLRQEITMYLGDIQDHIITMVQSLNHYEKLLARFHSNYLAQINIDMTKVNNDTNDALGKITVLGTIVLPINVVTGLWGMNCLVPGQSTDGLVWFYSIVAFMIVFSFCAYNYAKRAYGI